MEPCRESTSPTVLERELHLGNQVCGRGHKGALHRGGAKRGEGREGRRLGQLLRGWQLGRHRLLRLPTAGAAGASAGVETVKVGDRRLARLERDGEHASLTGGDDTLKRRCVKGVKLEQGPELHPRRRRAATVAGFDTITAGASTSTAGASTTAGGDRNRCKPALAVELAEVHPRTFREE